jgi:hypothetical protein
MCWRGWKSSLAAACVAWLGRSAVVQAQTPVAAAPPESRVLVLGTTPAIESALDRALSPWGLRVERRNPDDPLTQELLRAPENAALLAREAHAGALIWLAPSAPGMGLWLYDASSGATSVRPVPRGPSNATVSAALALSIKTRLRSTALAGPADEAEASVAKAETALPAGSNEPVDRGPSPATAREVVLQVLLAGALQGGAVSAGGSQTRFAAELRWAPWARRIWDATDLWLGARIDLGPRHSLTTPVFHGEYTALDLGLSLGLTRRLSPFFEVGAQLGASVDRSGLSGTLLTDSTRVSQSGLGSSLQFRAEAGVSFGPLALLLQPASGVVIRGQSYRADGAVVLETGQFWWQLGAGLRLNVY